MSFSTTLILALSAALVLGIAVIAVGIYTLRKSAATASWPKTMGKVASNWIEKKADSSIDDMESVGNITTYTYFPHVSYEFKVDNKTYTGKIIAIIGHSFNSESKAEEFLKNYPVGKEVEVSYNPAKPKDAVLEPGYSSGGYFFIALGILFALIGGIGLAVKFLIH